jgi:hypothetical protein
VGWGGIDAIPLLAGESPAQAVERVYAGGTVIYLDADDSPRIATIPGPPREALAPVSPDEHQWMLDAADLIQKSKPGWSVKASGLAAGERWPRRFELSHADSIMLPLITPEYANFVARAGEANDAEWRLWWRTIRSFARRPCVIYDPDNSEIVTTSLSAAAARERYGFV